MIVQQVNLCGHTNGYWAPGLWFEPVGLPFDIAEDQVSYRSKLNKTVSQKKLAQEATEYVHIQGRGTVTYVILEAAHARAVS